MDTFISNTLDKEAQGDDDLKLRATNSYIELIWTIETGCYIKIYLVPRSEHSIFVLACYDNAFDTILENIDDEDYSSTVRDTWPLLTQLLINGGNDRYSEGALIRAEDSDTGDTKWFLATVVGNIDLDEMICDRTLEAAKRIIALAGDLHHEMEHKSPSTFKAIAKGIGIGVLAAILGGAS